MENKPQRDNSRTVLAWVLIGIGMLLVLRKIGVWFHFPHIHFEYMVSPFRPLFHNFGNFFFSWQVLFIIIGLVLMAGRRSAGIVFVVIGGIFFFFFILFIPQITFSLLMPLVLIGLGIVLIARYKNQTRDIK